MAKTLTRPFHMITMLAILLSQVGILPVAAAVTFTVNSTVDVADVTPGDGICETTIAGGVCTLRAAIQEANALGGSNIIELQSSALYTLTLFDLQESRLLIANNDLTINGHSAVLQPDSSNGGRNFLVNSNASLAINDLTIQGGSTSGIAGDPGNGAGIYNNGSLTVNNSTFSGNHSASSGGGIYNAGTLTVTGSTFANNFAANGGGGINNQGNLAAVVTNSTFSSNSSDIGGGIYNNGGLTIDNSTFTGNSAASGNGGGIANFDNLTISNSQFSQNSAVKGGAIINRLNATANIFTSTFSSNQALGGAAGSGDGGSIINDGTLTVIGSSFTNNTAGISNGTSGGNGGGIYNTGSLTVENSTLSGNRANFTGGGGFYNSGTLVVNGATISNNSAEAGGGIYIESGNVTVTSSTFSANGGNNGGGIFKSSGTLNVTNSTFTNNTSGFGGGGIFFSGLGTFVTNSTFSNNAALISGRGGISGNSGIEVTNSIFDGNQGGNCESSPITDGGGNLSSDNTCPFSGSSVNNTDPLLGPLQDNGGPTQTMALLGGSPAIDKGDSANCPATDQRGVTRPQGTGCDIGAYEAENNIFMVTNTNDSGPDSLRQAIDGANSAANFVGKVDEIHFNIPGAGVQTIQPLSALPSITDPVIIDGYTQPGSKPNTLITGSDATLLIQLSGTNIIGSIGLLLQNGSAGSTIRGLVINNGFGRGILVSQGADGAIIQGNYIGTNTTGTIAMPNGSFGLQDAGVFITNAANVWVGGTAPGERNIISGNNGDGIALWESSVTGTIVKGNYIGVGTDGITALPNGGSGGRFGTDGGGITARNFTSNTLIGGTEPGAGNVIANNAPSGVISYSGSNTAIRNNTLTNNQNYGIFLIGNNHQVENNIVANNGSDGVLLSSGSNSIIDGNTITNNQDAVVILAGNGHQVKNNIITNNAGNGVLVYPPSSQTSIQHNNIYNNTGLGIDLNHDGPTPNDVGDPDSGANTLQNYPVMTSATIAPNGDLNISYSVDSSIANSAYPLTIEFYKADSIASGEGQTFLGSSSLNAPGSNLVNLGNATTLSVSSGDPIVAAATDANGNTSEFSQVVSVAANSIFTVTKTADTNDGACDADCSLREAITAANAHPNSTPLDEIHFNIPGAGVQTIQPTSPLPEITDPAFIDGTTQPNTACNGRPTALLIEVDGTNAGAGTSGLTLTAGASGSQVSGLVINRFDGNGLRLDGSNQNLIVCNIIGASADGLTAAGNGGAGVAILNSSSNNVIGTVATADQFNLISGNTGPGIEISGNAANNSMQDNFIGTDIARAPNLGNGNGGIHVGGSASNTEVVNNTIAGNTGRGVSIENSTSTTLVFFNSIFDNTGIGIDLGANGVTPNDPGDGDTGPNNLQNYPVLNSAVIDTNGDLMVYYSVDSLPANSTYPIAIEFFKADSAASGEGQSLLGGVYGASLNSPGVGSVNLGNAANLGVSLGDSLVATASDHNGNPNSNTSEFSPAVTVGTAAGNLFIVNSIGDSVDADPGNGVCETATPGECTLRAAIEEANAISGTNTITFDTTGTISLTADLPAISDDIIIDGGNPALVTINGLSTYGVMYVNSDKSLTIKNLTITKGGGFSCPPILSSLCGGAIYNNGGTVVVENSNFNNNNSSDLLAGSGIFNIGTLTVTNSTFDGNASPDGRGGAIANHIGTATITNSTFSGNTSLDGTGGAISNADGATIINSTFSDNVATFGGGIYNTGELTITNSVFSTNVAFVSPNLGGQGGGGAIYNFSTGNLVINNASISNNNSNTVGGGIDNAGILTVKNSTISNNSSSGEGGGIINYMTLTVAGSTFADNTSNSGGGISNQGNEATITNSTFFNNTAGLLGGGVENTGTLTLSNSTFFKNTNNTIPFTGEFGGAVDNSTGTLTLRNSILAESLLGNCNIGAGVTVTDGGGNLSSDNSCPFSGTSANNIDPLLGPLKDNGGLTQTMALLAGSPAIDTGVAAFCPATDQRGVTRPQGATCDIGAYEAGVSIFEVTNTNNSGPGSLRQAILNANAIPNGNALDQIQFNIPGAGVKTIQPASPLPDISDSVIIDGYTQPGAQPNTLTVGDNAVLLIELDGANAGALANGLRITAGNNFVRGLAINSFGGNGIVLNGAAAIGNVIQGNYIGLNAAGNTALRNGRWGIVITGGASNNTIGGTTIDARNLLSGNTLAGIKIENATTAGNLVQGNYIGTDKNGSLALSNRQQGVAIVSGAHNNIIGGTTIEARNIISGNGSYGIEIGNPGTTANTMLGNFIGVKADGTGPLPNDIDGILIRSQASSNIIGGTVIGARNLISGNRSSGVRISDAGTTGNLIEGNYIGTNTSGAASIPNGAFGMVIGAGASGNTVGNSDHDLGVCNRACNLISGNGTSGVIITGSGTTNNTIQGNYIGTNAGGTSAIPNANVGVSIADGASDNRVGGTGIGESNLIAFNDRQGVAVVGTSVRNVIRRNSIFSNNGLGIDLNGDGVTANDIGDSDVGPNDLLNSPVLYDAPAKNGITYVRGLFNAASLNTLYTIDIYSSNTCDPSGSGEGQTYLATTTATTDSKGNATFIANNIPALPDNLYITATLNDQAGNTSEYSNCVITQPGNYSWLDAYPLNLKGPVDMQAASASHYIDRIGRSRWYKFHIEPDSRVIVTLSHLPANYDIVLFKDIKQVDDSLNSPTDLAIQSVESAPGAHVNSIPFANLPFSNPGAHVNESVIVNPGAHVNNNAISNTGALSNADAFPNPEAFVNDNAFLSANAFVNAEAFVNPGAHVNNAVSNPGAHVNAILRSYVADSVLGGTASESIVVNTWNNTGDYYVVVYGYNEALDPTNPFQLDVSVLGGECSKPLSPILPSVSGTTLPTSDNGGAGYGSLILYDIAHISGSSSDLSTLQTNLTLLANRPEVRGALVDISQDVQVRNARNQADANPSCPYAKNVLAQEIKDIVTAYRAVNPNLENIVLVGNDDAIPFFRYPDLAQLSKESDYNPPVKQLSASQASLKLDYILGQDAYGATTEVSLQGTILPMPDRAVGRLVETASDVNTYLSSYLGTNGAVIPQAALVTGYNFLYDGSVAVQDALTKDVPPTTFRMDSLIDPPDILPSSPNAWTADDLRAELLNNGRHDLIYLAGHFSANLAFAANFDTKSNVVLTASEVANSTVSMTNSIIFSSGCHAGYNVVNADEVSGYPLEPDWAQAFARKGAVLVAGTGFQYGDSEGLEYGERLYLEFAKQLRQGTNTQSMTVGAALVNAKQNYLSATGVEVDGVYKKQVVISTLFGLPMLRVSYPYPAPLSIPYPKLITTTQSVSGNTLGLVSDDESIYPTLNKHTLAVTSTLDPTITYTATYLEGKDGKTARPGEPYLPLEIYNINPPAPINGKILRGVGFRHGSYTDTPNILSFTSVPATEFNGVHPIFVSDTFYPAAPLNINYYDLLAHPQNGETRLMATPAQYRSNGPNSLTGTLRQYDEMGFRFYYSARLGNEALADFPAISHVLATTSGSTITFHVNVTARPDVGVNQVWITYTATDHLNPTHGQWTSIDLAPNHDDPFLWEGTLTVDTTRFENVRYIVQAVNGVGLVSMATNNNAYYIPDIDPGLPTPPADPGAPPPAETTLILNTPAMTGHYNDNVTFSAQLKSSGVALPAGQAITFSLASQELTAYTDSSGLASATMTLTEVPGEYTIQAAFAGDLEHLGSKDSGSFTVTKQPTQIDLTVPAAPVQLGADSGVKAILSDDAQRRIPFQSALFIVTGSGGTQRLLTTTDFKGEAVLGPLTLAPGTYEVTAYFGQDLLSSFGIDLSHALYEGSLSNTKQVQIAPIWQNNTSERFDLSNGPLGGKNWFAPGGMNGFQVVNHQLRLVGSNPIYWRQAYNINQEAFVTLAKVDPNGLEQDLLLKVQGNGQADWQKGAIKIVYDAHLHTVRVETHRPTQSGWTAYANIPITLHNGDQLGARAFANGEVWILVNSSQVALVRLNPTDKTFFATRGGWTGLWFMNAINAMVDDFGGGTF